MNNYIADTNRFALAGPPLWWLRQLADYDDQLRVVPSRQYPIYLLARKARKNPVLEQHAELNPNRDIRMLASRGLVYVSTLEGTGIERSATGSTFSTAIFNELRRRDILHNGGWEACVKTLEAFEEADRATALAKVRDEEKYRDKEGYKHLKRRAGERLSAPGPLASSRTAHNSGSTVELGR